MVKTEYTIPWPFQAGEQGQGRRSGKSVSFCSIRSIVRSMQAFPLIGCRIILHSEMRTAKSIEEGIVSTATCLNLNGVLLKTVLYLVSHTGNLLRINIGFKF
uniref:(northern house mosquito) hypothetical protein n=1 Tax=Culex pipiens TaxID=7175 RepID=A0A8D8I167_CULPI